MKGFSFFFFFYKVTESLFRRYRRTYVLYVQENVTAVCSAVIFENSHEENLKDKEP